MSLTAYRENRTDAAGQKPVVLILLSHYLPGYKAGGPIRSIANIVEALGDEIEFRIVTSDRDIGAAVPYDQIAPCQWSAVGKARVFYLPRTWRAMFTLARMLFSTPADLLYLNSFFARRFSMSVLLLRKLRLLSPKSILLAPRGEFSRGALHIKAWRKRAYIALARKCGLYTNVLWHASSQFEENDIHRAFCSGETIAIAGPITPKSQYEGRHLRIMTALDMPGAGTRREIRTQHKPAGRLRLIFLSRISRKKNLDGAISMLHHLSGEIEFDIYGPIEDAAYWKLCESRIAQLPPNVKVQYRGELPHEAVHQTLASHDLLFFPTHGENYGHVIREALSAGCPILVSDQTPWRNLESLGVGWDIPLGDTGSYREVIQKCIDMSPEAFAEWTTRAYEYGLKLEHDPEIIGQNRRLFARALGYEHLGNGVEIGELV